jgi:hypothetical protein
LFEQAERVELAVIRRVGHTRTKHELSAESTRIRKVGKVCLYKFHG